MTGAATADVAVLGCGHMGSALARALARAGKQVVVWNRTPGKAQALAGPGTRAAGTLGDALTAAPVVLACLTTYDDLTASLAGASWTPGTTLVNVASGGPGQATELERWAADRGLAYLDGAIFAYPADIEAGGGLIGLAGPDEAWARHAEVLGTLAGDVVHLSSDVSVANVLDVGVTGGFYLPALTAFVETATYTAHHQVSPEALLSVVRPLIAGLAQQVEEAVRALAVGDVETDQVTIGVYAQAARATVAAMRGEGHAGRMIGAASEALDLAEAAGLGDLGLFALHGVCRPATAEAGHGR